MTFQELRESFKSYKKGEIPREFWLLRMIQVIRKNKGSVNITRHLDELRLTGILN